MLCLIYSCSIMYFLCLNLQSGILLCTTPICVVPVINSVAAKVLSLRDVQITIILNETGGQPVENTVSHYTLCIVACCHANTSLRCFLSVICCCFLSVPLGYISTSGHNQWHSDDIQWVCRFAVHWKCHRTVSDEWSDLQRQCGGKEQCWSKRDVFRRVVHSL